MTSDHLSPKGDTPHGPSPILLTVDGEPVIPTVIPPSTDFDDYATHDKPTGDISQDTNYFDLKPVRKIPTEPFSAQDLDRMPAPNRAQTTASHAVYRPQYATKKSSLFSSFTKKNGTGAIHDRNASYSYAFDPMSSESESSSDEAGSAGKEKHKHKHRIHRPHMQTSKTENFHQLQNGSDKKRREQAKRGRSYSRFAVGNEYLHTKGKVSKRDGRLNISINETSNNGYVAKTLGQSIQNHLDIPKRRHAHLRAESANSAKPDGALGIDPATTDDMDAVISSLHTRVPGPRMNIVIMVIGSRGDIQPFVRLAALLKEKHGHRVRIASHPVFRDFVEKDAGLDFFSVGGDPSELMAFMVKNPGLIPNLKTIREGEIARRRDAMRIMFEGFWRACINTTDDEGDDANLKMMGNKEPFVADAIIANPPSMAHVHIAEKLGIPLHMMFTFPYSPTQQFPHPLANIRPGKSNVDPNYVNFMSYPMVEMMTWQGLGDIVNRFRERTLGLEPVSSLWAPGALYRMRVPYTYLWSPSLVAKPKDWGPEIDIAGFAFLDLASKFKPEKDLEDFLNAGEPPVYIGFGSIVIDDPNGFTDLIFKATKMAGVRALVNKGWGGLGGDDTSVPDHIFMLGNTPHDWLFPRVKAVIHHGGAGTTAIGLKCAKPTMIVPFFGDQPFWGAMVAEAKAGAFECTPYKDLTVEKLAEGIKQCLSDEAQANVQKIADSIAAEGDGAENAVKSFHRTLNLAGSRTIRCSILEDRVAVWQLRNSALRLSALAATILHQKGKIKMHELKLIRHNEWNDFDGPGEPITGGIGAVKDSLYDMGEGFGMVPVRIARHIRKHEEHVRKREEREQRRAERKVAKADQREQAKSKQTSKSQGTSSAPSNKARPAEPARTQTTATQGSVLSTESAPVTRKVAEEVGRGFEQAGWALLTMPNDLHVAVARGFHNAPRLWGDSTVRKPVRVTGFKSGCQAAGQEFVFGLWDGCTGLVMQPVGDWKDGATIPQKVAGLGTGVGKGVGGLVLKTISAVISPPAYFGQGVIRYTEKKMHGPSTKSFLRRAHTLQGSKDLLTLQMEKDQNHLKQIEDLVLEGWRVFDAIWKTANKEYGLSETESSIVKRLRFFREKRRWQDAGLLENITTARQALDAYANGESMDAIFTRRREELRLADQPRAGVMDRPETPGEEQRHVLAVLPDGKSLASSYAGKEQEERKTDNQKSQQPDLGKVDEEEDASSDATAVEKSDDEHDGAETGSGKVQANPKNMPDSTVPNKGDIVKTASNGDKDLKSSMPSANEKGVSMDKVISSAPRAGMVGV